MRSRAGPWTPWQWLAVPCAALIECGHDRDELDQGPGEAIFGAALVGDAELDEGAVWEALLDPMVAKLAAVDGT